VVALCTGSQGEQRAALARIALDEHPDVTLSRGDRVIFSSRTIPGNERAVNRVINGLVRQGIEVITDRTHLVHVSGHPRRAELEELYGWVRPRILVPVHGEALHLAEHAALGRRIGVPQTLTCSNGDLVRLAPGGAEIVDELPQGRLYRDGRLVIDAESRTVADRRRLGFVGVVSVAFAIDAKGALAGAPVVESLGIPDLAADGRRLDEVAHEAANEAIESMPRARRRDPESVADAVRRAVRAAVAVQWGKKPLCLVHVLTL
jgi:ribonuclease J